MEIKVKLLPPTMPNFIGYESPAKPRQEGFKLDGACMAVSDLTNEQAEEYAELMKQTFLNHHANKKNKQP